jgi:hypothetical protein
MRTPSGSSAARDFDPAAVLERDPRVLLDPHFLGPLHDELWSTLAPEDAALALRQIGVLHGLQDAASALVRMGAARPDAFALPLAIRVRRPSPASGLDLEGSWPEAREASARLEFGLGAHGPACHLSAGYTSGWLTGLFDVDLLAVETECAAEGHGACRFVVRESSVWRRDAPELRWLHELPLAAYRSLVRERARRLSQAAAPAPEGFGAIERGSACVHLWGPVMVMPFGGPEEALRALDLLQRDPGARDVSVLVVDLRDAVIDEAFGALALEQIVGSASAWGAEVVLADPSPVSRRAIDALDHPPLLVAKSLEEAVASAFQIARAQRCRA